MMRRLTRTFAPVSLLAVALLMLCGFSRSGASDSDVSPDHPDDPRWAEFRGVTVATDKARGLLTARFPKDLKAADGRPIEIGGYIVPLENSPDTSHFILTRRSTGCPFCPPNEANEAVEVFLKKTTHYEQRQFFIKGVLKLEATSNQGLFFRIVDASAS